MDNTKKHIFEVKKKVYKKPSLIKYGNIINRTKGGYHKSDVERDPGPYRPGTHS